MLAYRKKDAGGAVKVFSMLLRFWSYLFAMLVGLFAAGVSFVILISGADNYRLDMIPFAKGNAALMALLGLGLLGVLSGLLAVFGKARALLVIFAALAFFVLVYGYFVSPVYRFTGAAEAKGALWLAFGALGAFFGSLMQFRKSDA